jgi:hypothetical protein
MSENPEENIDNETPSVEDVENSEPETVSEKEPSPLQSPFEGGKGDVLPLHSSPVTRHSTDSGIKREMNRRLFVSLLTGTAAYIAGFSAWKWIAGSEKSGEIPWQLRKVHEINEKLTQAYYNPDRLAPTFNAEKATEPRPNGDIGLKDDFDPAEWQLEVTAENGLSRNFSLDDIKALPVVEMVTELKCIEGWSTIVHWKGARLFDFLTKHRFLLPTSKYVGMETPDKEYYVGLDIESAIHPQTLLAYEMNGSPLTSDHGAPLRLVTPLKYGIKHIKRIGTITLSRQKPADYWAEQGYDWYSGH